MILDHSRPNVASLELSTIRRRRFLQVIGGGACVLLFGKGALPVAAEQSAPQSSAAPSAPADVSPSLSTPSDAQGISPGALIIPRQTGADAHYSSFFIGADGVIRRSLSASPMLPSLQSVLRAPYYSQFDGSVYAESNCGPTSLAMALGALGVPAAPLALRALANHQMGTNDPNNGTSWDALAYAARQNGVSVFGLTDGASNQIRQWTMSGLLGELAKKRPVLMLIRYWDLPDHRGSSYAGDHYIVALGIDEANNVVYNDPASNDGSDLRVSPADLLVAWQQPASGLAFTAMSLYR